MRKIDDPGKQLMSEEEIDENLAKSFPASDPPSWNLGTNHLAVGKSSLSAPPQPKHGVLNLNDSQSRLKRNLQRRKQSWLTN